MAENDGAGLPAEPDPRMLRVSDAEREHVVGLLQKAVGRGLITLDEFSSRTDRALAARTRGELNSVLIDLPDLRHTAVSRAPADQPLVLNAGAGTVRHSGHWTVPRTIRAECGMGTMIIDFTDAACPHREVTLHANCGAGTISVIVPRGWHVVMVEVTTRFGSVVNKATDPPDPAMPVLRVHGRAGMGTIKLRHPRSHGWWGH